MSLDAPESAVPQRLRFKHTSNDPAHLAQLGISVLVMTNHAEKLVLLRAEGVSTSRQVRAFQLPMERATDFKPLVEGVVQMIR